MSHGGDRESGRRAREGAYWRGQAVNLGGAVYAELCERLVKGHFQPDDRLRIRDLAESLGTSVTPVRDAVLRLVQDNALVMRSQRDIRVPRLTLEQYLELRTIRMTLEGLAAEVAAQHADAALIASLEQTVTETRRAIELGDFQTAAEFNQRFHFRLADGARMPMLRRILQRLWLQMGPVIADASHMLGWQTIAHHQSVLEALERADGAAASEAVRRDIMEGGRSVLDRIRQLDGGGGGGGTPLP